MNSSNYPYPEYDSNQIAAILTTIIIGIGFIAYVVQSIQSNFNPRRVIVLILATYLTILIELILRALLSSETRNSRIPFTIMTVLRAISLRTAILANYDFLTRIRPLNRCVSRSIIIGSSLGTAVSAILMIPAGSMSYNQSTIDTSFQLRQASSAISLAMTILFYPVWLLTKTVVGMTQRAIILLLISSTNCFIIALYLVITSVHQYYIAVNKQEFWFYIFQYTPLTIVQLAWTILYPIRCLTPAE